MKWIRWFGGKPQHLATLRIIGGGGGRGSQCTLFMHLPKRFYWLGKAVKFSLGNYLSVSVLPLEWSDCTKRKIQSRLSETVNFISFIAWDEISRKFDLLQRELIHFHDRVGYIKHEYTCFRQQFILGVVKVFDGSHMRGGFSWWAEWSRRSQQKADQRSVSILQNEFNHWQLEYRRNCVFP